jgi:hypothetical protein
VSHNNIIVSQRNQSDIPTVSEVVRRLRSIAVHSLARMYRPEEHMFAFRLRRNGQGEVLEGVSRRYTAVALIGLAGEDEPIAAEVLGNHSRENVCGRLIADSAKSQELGEVALTTWAARMLQHPCAHKAVDMLRRADPAGQAYPTVELSWALTALVVGGSEATDMVLAKRIADVLFGSFRQESGLFPHVPGKKGASALRAHVSCFADFAYPIQALSHYHQATGDAQAAEIACRCAARMCQLQGPQGQWWWHFDVRTGRVVEGYPVYSVHQDSMAPMALFALAEACGRDYSESIDKGLRWLSNPAEITGSLIDIKRNVIWRKVARHEPGKLVRGLQATASRLHPAIRVPGVDVVFPAVSVDYESRPYHMGWILHTWPANQTSESLTKYSGLYKKPYFKA